MFCGWFWYVVEYLHLENVFLGVGSYISSLALSRVIYHAWLNYNFMAYQMSVTVGDLNSGTLWLIPKDLILAFLMTLE